MSEAETLRASAEDARKNRRWNEAVEIYTELLEKTYHDEANLTLQNCLDLINYAKSLVNQDLSSGEQDADDECLETAWDCLENARSGLEHLPESERPVISLIDIHDILGDISFRNANYSEAADQYRMSSEIEATVPEISWRIPLNSQYCRVLSLECDGKKKESLEILSSAIAFLDHAISLEKDQKALADMRGIREDLGAKLKRSTEQDAPKASQ